LSRISDPNIQIDPNLGKSNQIKSNQYLLISNQIKLGVQFDLIYLLTSLPLPPHTTALEWWLRPEQQWDYPRLSQMAVGILSIPAMSAEPERIFSGARRTITWSRQQLSGAMIEKLECLKSWIRENISKGLGFTASGPQTGGE
jgi:hypothetical protein